MFASWGQPLVNADQHDETSPDDGLAQQSRCGDASRPWRAEGHFDGHVEGRFAEWAESMRPRLAGLARRFLWNSHDADEITQDALMLAWREIRKLSEPGQRNAWVYRTTINLSLNRLRRRRADILPPADLLPERQPDAARHAEAKELTERVRIAMSQLPERQEAALVLRELEGLSYGQIAAILEASPAATRLLVHRARETVRRILERRWPDSFETNR